MPSSTAIKEAYENSGSRAQSSYEVAIGQVDNWNAAATSENAEKNYAAGVNEAVAQKTRQKSLKKVTDSEWKDRSQKKGAPALATGIAQSGDKQAKGFDPFRSALDGLTLPPRTRDGMLNLTNRGGAVVKALQAKKKSV
jgi:hypothetical protein